MAFSVCDESFGFARYVHSFGVRCALRLVGNVEAKMFAGLADLVKQQPKAQPAPGPRPTASSAVPKAAPAPQATAPTPASPQAPTPVAQPTAAPAAQPLLPERSAVQAELRRLGEPITLFAESDEARWKRLGAARGSRDAAAGSCANDASDAAGTRAAAVATPPPASPHEQHLLDLKNARVAATAALEESARSVTAFRNDAANQPAELSEATDPEVIDRAHEFILQHVRYWLAKRQLRVLDAVVGESFAMSLRAWREVHATATDLAPLEELLERRQCPPKVLKTLYEVYHHVNAGRFADADNAYFSLAIGSDAWRIGVYSGGIHERAITRRVHRGMVKHVMNNAVVRKFMLATKQLIGEAERASRPQQAE